MDQEILKADPAFRKRLLVIIGIVVILGILLIGIVIPRFLIPGGDSADPAQALNQLKWLLAIIYLPLLGFCVYLVSMAIRSWRQEVFPPLGTRVIKDTPIFRGQKARHKALGIIILAIVLLSCIFYSAYLVDQLLASLWG